jgi:hypothetical protein
VFPIAWIAAAVVLSDDLLMQIGIFLASPIAGFIALAGAAAIFHTVQHALDWRVATERRAAIADLRRRRVDVVAVIDEVLGA